jgi:hypothetical protein
MCDEKHVLNRLVLRDQFFPFRSQQDKTERESGKLKHRGGFFSIISFISYQVFLHFYFPFFIKLLKIKYIYFFNSLKSFQILSTP